jgi:type II secretory pathway pseudopilin PulG
MPEIPSVVSIARQRGFTLVELAVSLFVTLSVLFGVLMLFDFSNKLSRVQTNVTDMQQSLRVAQYDMVRLIRMAGRGGLEVGNLPAGGAVAVRDNVAANATIGAAGSPVVAEGSDVLTVRGVFNTPIFQINSADPEAFKLTMAGGVPVSGTIRVRNSTPTGIPQELKDLKAAVDGNRREALLIVSPQNSSLYGVVELDPSASNVSNAAEYVIGFRVTGGSHTTDYAKLDPGGTNTFPATLTNAAFLGILEEYRFYIREDHAIAGNAASDLTSKLSRARVYPATETPHGDDAESWSADIADNIIDLQVALGLDTANGGCRIADDETKCSIAETANGQNDDWMFNAAGEAGAPAFAGSDLHYVRLNTLARTDRRDKEFQSPELERIEDRAFNASSAFNTRNERMYRRRLLRTVVDMRNL